MNLKYVKNQTDSEATMLLYNEINSGVGIDGARFAEEMYWLSKNVPLINVRINSPGGSVFEGYSIYSAMREVKVPVDTYNDFIAASMAGIIAQQGRKRYAADNSIIMLHNPMGGGESIKDKEILSILKNSLVDAYVARSGKDAKTISEIMDVETWIEARKVNGISAMLEMGLADKLFSSSVKMVSPDAQIFNANKLYSISNKILIKEDMENQELETKVAEMTASLEVLKSNSEILKAENEALKKEISDKDVILNDAKDKSAVELVENAIKEGKVKAESRETLIANAKSSFDVVKNMLDAMPASTASRFINVVDSVATKVDSERAGWTIRDYEEKDEAALADIYKNQPELYKEMYNKFYTK